MQPTNPDTLLQSTVELLLQGKAPAADDVVELWHRYPFFTLPARQALTDGNASLPDALLNATALSAADPELLFPIIEGLHTQPFYPAAPQKAKNTVDTIDSFLDRYASGQSRQEEELLERMIFNPTPDYAQILAEEEQHDVPHIADADPGSQDDLLNRFIIKQRQQSGTDPNAPRPAAAQPVKKLSGEAPQPRRDDSLLGASLAKIFIRQGNFAKAHEIISDLSLKYPQKSIYFADQLRYLKILIARQERIKAKTGAADN